MRSIKNIGGPGIDTKEERDYINYSGIKSLEKKEVIRDFLESGEIYVQFSEIDEVLELETQIDDLILEILDEIEDSMKIKTPNGNQYIKDIINDIMAGGRLDTLDIMKIEEENIGMNSSIVEDISIDIIEIIQNYETLKELNKDTVYSWIIEEDLSDIEELSKDEVYVILEKDSMDRLDVWNTENMLDKLRKEILEEKDMQTKMELMDVLDDAEYALNMKKEKMSMSSNMSKAIELGYQFINYNLEDARGALRHRPYSDYNVKRKIIQDFPNQFTELSIESNLEQTMEKVERRRTINTFSSNETLRRISRDLKSSGDSILKTRDFFYNYGYRVKEEDEEMDRALDTVFRGLSNLEKKHDTAKRELVYFNAMERESRTESIATSYDKEDSRVLMDIMENR